MKNTQQVVVQMIYQFDGGCDAKFGRRKVTVPTAIIKAWEEEEGITCHIIDVPKDEEEGDSTFEYAAWLLYLVHCSFSECMGQKTPDCSRSAVTGDMKTLTFIC